MESILKMLKYCCTKESVAIILRLHFVFNMVFFFLFLFLPVNIQKKKLEIPIVSNLKLQRLIQEKNIKNILDHALTSSSNDMPLEIKITKNNFQGIIIS